MIVVWNENRGDILGFKDIASYSEWIERNPEWNFWGDQVHDVGEGGMRSEENQVDMQERREAFQKKLDDALSAGVSR